jgi:hypothetical protein
VSEKPAMASVAEAAEAGYDRLSEYHAANDELRRLSHALDHATDDDYEDLHAAYSAQRRLVREIAQTVTSWTA